jgi:hypothetical protein
MAERLRIGVLGLGRRWRRYRRALKALAKQVRVVALQDVSLTHAEAEAKRLNCEAVGGVVELIERADVDAVLLLRRGWHGLWPLEQATKAEKPVLCAIAPREEENRVALVNSEHIHMALWPTLTVLRESLTEKMQQSLGSPLFAQVTITCPYDRSVALLRECADLMGATPERVTRHEASGLESYCLHFAQGRLAQVNVWKTTKSRSGCRIHVEADKGALWAELPNRVSWQDDVGRYTHELPATLAETQLLAHFVDAMREKQPPLGSFAKACEPLEWMRTARPSR